MKDSIDKNTIIIATGEEDSDFLPLLSQDDEDNMNKEIFPNDLPILSLRNNVLFPGVMIPITIGRDKSLKLLQDANKGSKIIGVVAQINQDEENPEFKDLYRVGTVAQIIRLLKMPDGTSTVIIQGKRRFEITEPYQTEPYLRAKVQFLTESLPDKDDQEMELIFRNVKDLALQIIKESPNIPSEAAFAIGNIESPTFMVNFISSNMNADVTKKQELLEELDFRTRAMKVVEHLTLESQLLEMRNEIQSKVRLDMDKQQRDYFLQQQIRTIQDELGDNPHDQDIREMEDRAKKKKWSKDVAKLFQKELNKLQRMNPQGAEYTVQLNYLDMLLELPWNEYSKDNINIIAATDKIIYSREWKRLAPIHRMIKLKEYFEFLPASGFKDNILVQLEELVNSKKLKDPEHIIYNNELQKITDIPCLSLDTEGTNISSYKCNFNL